MSMPSAKALRSCGNLGDMGQNAQFDLAVIGRDQLHPLLGHEGRADLAACLCAHRDVLEIGPRIDDSRPVVVAASEKEVCTRPFSSM